MTNLLFLDRHTANYDLDLITKEHSLILKNNIELGGRVANFIINIVDIAYYKDILNTKIFIEPIYNINTIKDVLDKINMISQWIQLRLNTRHLFRNSNWNDFNKQYVEQCFNSKDFTTLSRSKLSHTNIRNLFFGDCREHEVLLNILTQLFLKKHNLFKKYRVRKLYTKGITISDNIKHQQAKKDSILYTNNTIFNYKTGGYINEHVSEEEHTHPVLYDIDNDKLYAIDAVKYKTKWNPLCDTTHGIELFIINISYTDTKLIPYIHYKNIIDKEFRTYIEIPTFFSNEKPRIINNQNTSLLFGVSFNIHTSTFLSQKKYKDYVTYGIIDIEGIEDFKEIIKLLCFTKKTKTDFPRARSLPRLTPATSLRPDTFNYFVKSNSTNISSGEDNTSKDNLTKKSKSKSKSKSD